MFKECIVMLFASCGSKGRLRISLFALAASLCCVWFATPAYGQHMAPPTPAVASGETAKPGIDKAKATGTRPAEPPTVLQQLNASIAVDGIDAKAAATQYLRAKGFLQ